MSMVVGLASYHDSRVSKLPWFKMEFFYFNYYFLNLFFNIGLFDN